MLSYFLLLPSTHLLADGSYFKKKQKQKKTLWSWRKKGKWLMKNIPNQVWQRRKLSTNEFWITGLSKCSIFHPLIIISTSVTRFPECWHLCVCNFVMHLKLGSTASSHRPNFMSGNIKKLYPAKVGDSKNLVILIPFASWLRAQLPLRYSQSLNFLITPHRTDRGETTYK